jgi:LacI family transcriptional regulator
MAEGPLPESSPKRVTIIDIAKRLGISAMTVSRALNGKSEVRPRTRQKVLRCAAALGYQPDRWARSLVTRRSSMIGVVIPDISHSYFAEITFGAEEVLDRFGYDILLCHSRGDSDKEKAEIDMLVGSRVAGLIVASEQPEWSAGTFLELRKKAIPFVLVDRFFPKLDFAAVRADDRAVGILATECLIELGHTRIAHIRGPELSPASLRHRGYLEALREAGIPADKKWIVGGSFDIESGRRAMKKLLKMDARPTGVFAGNDPMAIGAVYACREAGLRVPDDISIVGAGNIEGPYHPNPFVTTLDWPRKELGRTAATMLLAAIENGASKHAMVKVFEPKLLARQSTDSPPAWQLPATEAPGPVKVR